VATDVTPVLAGLLAGNDSPDPLNPGQRRRSDYGVSARLDGNMLDVVLTFRRAAAYCCYEWGCHLALTHGQGKRWDRLRRALAAHGVAAPARLELRLSCVVEEGAMFFDFSKPDPTRRGWYAFGPAQAHHYQARMVEARAES
jgi:hypothetical protein